MKKCDLVMKGGITSGIIYPGAVCELATEYQFANIGGTSAGAIAAALTAAAELRRQKGSAGGFEELSRLPAWLAGTSNGRSRLLQLFQPSEATSPFFELALAWIETRGPRLVRTLAVLRALARHFNRYGSMVLAGGVLLMVLTSIAALELRDGSPLVAAGLAVVFLISLLGTALGFFLAACVEGVVSLARVLPEEGFGICSGMGPDGAGLTQWLDAKISEVAGMTEPLTFGDLEQAGVHLEMMTTNLTHGRPYRLPFRTKHFSFDEREMRRLFPDRIVQWMMDHAPRKSVARGRTLHAFPRAAELPVVVAARMSLSFPLLLSAVPLWAIDFGRRDQRLAPERCWFSDGGITSNFPVHFFDAPLPRWPTFAINLAPKTKRYHEEAQTTYVPGSNRGGILEWWSPFTTLFGFIKAIAETMQNWRDNMLLRLPGQRDRIAHVLLEPHEGGLNLTMDPGTIEQVAARGREAAATLRAHFGDTPPQGVTLTWRNHKWVRYLAFMPALEEAMESWSRAFPDLTAPPSFQELLTQESRLPSYRIAATERASMRDASLAFLQHLQQNFSARPFRLPAKRPRPNPELRAMARE